MVKANEKPSISSCATDDTLLGTFTFQDKISGPVSYLREKWSVSLKIFSKIKKSKRKERKKEKVKREREKERERKRHTIRDNGEEEREIARGRNICIRRTRSE